MYPSSAVHSETGLVTLRQLLLHAVNHLRHHLRLVAEKRAAVAARQVAAQHAGENNDD